MSKYRFKTEEEFKRDGLWKKDLPFRWVKDMLKYLGTDIPDKLTRHCDKQEKFRHESWHIEPHDYVLKETAFVLPSKWCIKVDRDCQPEEVYKWRQFKWFDAGYINEDKDWTSFVLRGHTEITLEQFKQHVLKESSVVETTKEIDMKAIQKEAKKRFPIGCEFMNTSGDGPFTLKEESYTYDISGMNIWAHYGVGCLYENGKWATLVSSPETTKEMFYQGDYIVTLDVVDGYNCARKNYCFKQRITNKGIYPTVDLQGITSNGHSVMSFDKKQWLKDWRYATPEEAAEYERLGKPYDVTTLQKKEESIPEYVECVSYFADRFTGKIYNTKIDTPEKNSSCSWKQILIEHNRLKDGSFKPSTKEAYDDQYAPKKLKKEDLVKGEIYIYDGSQISTYPEGPSISIDEQHYTSNPKWMWRLSITHATEEQKALLRREIERNSKPEIMWPSDPIVEQKISTPSIKKETFIDNVQSVDVMLRTKRKSIKF